MEKKLLKKCRTFPFNSQQLTQGQQLASGLPTLVANDMMCARHFLQTHCNQDVKKTDNTVGGVLLLQDLSTNAFIQNDRLVSKEDFYKKKWQLSSYRSKNSKKQQYKFSKRIFYLFFGGKRDDVTGIGWYAKWEHTFNWWTWTNYRLFKLIDECIV